MINNIKDIFSDLRLDQIKIIKEQNILKIELIMWSRVHTINLTFSHLTKLSKLLNTDNINVGESEFKSGCDTCDFRWEEKLLITVMDCEES